MVKTTALSKWGTLLSFTDERRVRPHFWVRPAGNHTSKDNVDSFVGPSYKVDANVQELSQMILYGLYVDAKLRWTEAFRTAMSL